MQVKTRVEEKRCHDISKLEIGELLLILTTHSNNGGGEQDSSEDSGPAGGHEAGEGKMLTRGTDDPKKSS